MSTMTLSPSSRSPRNGARGFRTFAGLLAILALMLLGTNVCRAAAGAVLDNGGFFSEQAKSDAAKVIGEIGRTLHEDLVVETFKEIPADVKAGVNLQDKTALSHLFEQWAAKQFRQKGVNGVYVLIVKEPAHLQVNVGNNTQRQAFTLQDRDALSSLMRAKLHAHQNDEALRDGANFVFATMKSHSNLRAHTGSAPPVVTSHPVQQSSGSGGWLIPAIVIGVVVWLVIGLFRALSGRMGGGSAMGQPGIGGGGGGGFLSSLVGGMFGAAAGMWMYDQFFSNHGSSAFGSDRNDPSGGDSGFSGQDTDSTGSGGDFGSDSDGGSSGGDDSGGGGDFGAGDSGGGGDF